MSGSVLIENSIDCINQPADLCANCSFEEFHGIGVANEAADNSIASDSEVIVYNIKTNSSKQTNKLIRKITGMNGKICIFLPPDEFKAFDKQSILKLAPINRPANESFRSGVDIFIMLDERMPLSRKSINPDKPHLKQYSCKKAKRHLLTDRESEIVNYLLQGLLYKEIAMNMGISIQTVKSHLKHIYSKLGVNSRTEVLLKYL